MSEQRHESPRDNRRPALMLLPSILIVLLAAGCDKIQIPDLGQSGTPPAGGGATNPTGQAAPPVPVNVPVQPAKPDPKAVVAAFLEKARGAGQLQDQDLLNVTELTEGLDEVTELKLIGANITDKGVSRLSKFPKLVAVDLGASLVTDEGLAVIKEMPELQTLGLEGTKISDKSMAMLAEHGNLKELSLSHDDISDFGLSLLGELENLEVLDISYCARITGAGFEKFKKNKVLRVVRGQHSGIQNGAMKFLSHCPIEELNLDVTGINDAGMMFIGKMSKMKKLSLEFCGVSDFGVKKMVIMKDLESISFRNNSNITGFLFDKLKSCKKLKAVNVSGTKVTNTEVAVLMKLIPGCKVMN